METKKHHVCCHGVKNSHVRCQGDTNNKQKQYKISYKRLIIVL